MRSVKPAVCLLVAFGGPLLSADQIRFNNGDRPTGTILRSDAKNLIIRTAVAGEVVVLWQEIRKIRSDKSLHVELADRRIRASSVTSHEGRVEIVTDTGTTLEASTDMLLAVRNDAEQARYEKSRHADILHRWDGGVDAGMDLTRGNSETRSFRLAFVLYASSRPIV